jgi:sugar (pentulose or hexulose) kinase
VADRAIITLDIGKTHAKLTLWDHSGKVIARQVRPNAALDGVLDAAGIEDWLSDTLRSFATQAHVGAIIPVAHGAAAALVADNQLICLPRDYEAPIPADFCADYTQLRAPFVETGSPRLPNGLNLGAQLFAQKSLITGQILLWPQYWSWLLSGVASSEVTSLGTHTDLWNPATGSFSSLVTKLGWSDRFPALRRASDILGPITPAWSSRAGLPNDTKVYCGVHDSNAALVAARGFAEISDGEATVLSTGTWFVAMRNPAKPINLAALPEGRDCLINVDVHGRSIPSSRFMGGREIEILGERIDVPELDGLAEVISARNMICPSLTPGYGPFPHGKSQWLAPQSDPGQRRCAIALYAALMADTALELIGACDTLLIEGRFAAAEVFVRALATLRPEMNVYTSAAEADVSFGTLRLVDPSIKPQRTLKRIAPLPHDLSGYKAEWHHRIDEGKRE